MKPFLSVVLVVTLFACSGPPTGEGDPWGDAGSPGQDAGADAGSTRPWPAPLAANGAIPCDVAQVLQSCTSCHGLTPTGGAPMSLATYDALIQPSAVDPGLLVIDRAIARMADAARPMPPSGLMPSQSLGILTDWRNEGLPPASAGCLTDPTPMCTSGTSWSYGNSGSDRMNPGRACIDCHTKLRGPSFSVGGTLYPTLREPDLCNGANPNLFAGAQVEIINADGSTVPLQVNSVGNFFLYSWETNLKLPIRARVKYGGKVREMQGAQNSGDCNSCHTEYGTNGAPGRITLPE